MTMWQFFDAHPIWTFLAFITIWSVLSGLNGTIQYGLRLRTTRKLAELEAWKEKARADNSD